MTSKILIFTDLDGTLLDRETFKFESIKNFIKDLISKNVSIIPNSSKTNLEIINFNKDLDKKLPFIVENGAAIYGMNLINPSFPEKIVLSRDTDEILKIFNDGVPSKLASKCKFILKLKKEIQLKIFGLPEEKLSLALNREYSIPIKFEGDRNEKNDLLKILKKINLSLQEGGRVINLCDKVSKARAMIKVIKIFKKIENQKIVTIGVGDNYNDLEMLKNSDIPCLVFNDKFKLDKINIDNCIVSRKPAPDGWEEVVKMALDKIK